MLIRILNSKKEKLTLERAFQFLTMAERNWEKVNCQGLRRSEWVIGRYALKKHMHQLATNPHLVSIADLEFLPNRNGEPSFTYQSINVSSEFFDDHISLSHKPPYFLTASSNKKLEGRIGVDLEKVQPYPDSFWKACLTKNEFEYTKKNFDNDPDARIKIWTLKEAYLKALGFGFSISPSSIDCLPVFNNSIDKIMNNTIAWKWKSFKDYIYSVVTVRTDLI